VTLLGFPLYLLLSGDAVFVGAALVTVGAALPRWPIVARWTVLVGLTFVLLSALALAWFAYIWMGVSAIVWFVSPPRRMGRIILILSSLLLAAGAAWQRQSVATSWNPARPVFVIGDSLSAGLGASSAGAWPQVWGERAGFNVTNLAHAGARLDDALEQVKRVPPDGSLIVLEIGGNDLLGGRTVAAFAGDLERLLVTTRQNPHRVVMFELPLVPFCNSYGLVQRRLCARYRVALIPRRVLAEAVACYATDGVHLSLAGHVWLAAQIEGIIAPSRSRD
jgi:lysophospholipase L1-like esterase